MWRPGVSLLFSFLPYQEPLLGLVDGDVNHFDTVPALLGFFRRDRASLGYGMPSDQFVAIFFLS